ncbi:hypothetical protein TARUN_742 [Trichoderma arundinaceum]|uniref:Nephrocystin 3-like N-terminal domain-containing protein n=1 Tax=Trichoderma arundinaceum TaxID=490622 RepID=A0A395P0B7_TRIAR|nr:hypothetical protein TARUN_742 [Trichoderma arundinaceum]
MYNAARDKHGAGTGDWLTKEGEEFKIGRHLPLLFYGFTERAFLHRQFAAGYGKSILSSVVVKYLQDQHAPDPSTALAYFFFSFSDLKKQKVNQMLTSLVKQLCSRRPDTPEPIENLSEYKEKGQRPDTQTLEAMLAPVARGFSAVHIAIDALDECPTLPGERKKILGSLRRIITAAPANLHILCTSRKEADIDAVLSVLLSPPWKAAAIDLTARLDILDGDIGLFIDLTSASEEYSSWPEDIKQMACKHSQRIWFQYVFSQLETLQQLFFAFLIRKALQVLPIGLDATYDRLLPSLDMTFRTQIIRCLKWLAFSNEVLLLKQLAEIFILCPKRALPFDETQRLFQPKDILRYLSSLVVVQDHAEWSRADRWRQGSSARLAHFSVKEYLISSRISEGPAVAFLFGEVDAHLHIAHCCLAYHLQHSAMAHDNRDDLKLMSYAAIDWPSHLEKVPRASWLAGVTQDAARALAVRSPSLGCMLREREEENKRSHRHLMLRSEEFRRMMLRPQCYTVKLGFIQLTDMLLSRENGINIYLTREDLNAALHEAAYRGSTAVVQLCLNKGAGVNSESEFFGDALQAAAHEGHAAIVRILLNNGADINAQRGGWGSALQAAAAGMHLHVLKLLVGSGADINFPSNESGCVLTSPVSRFSGGSSSLECLRYLLDAGADVNRRGGGPYETALHEAACSLGYTKEHFHLLLRRGADVNALGGDYSYPLQAACTYNEANEKYQVVELLLDRGADVNVKGGKWGNALQAACWYEREYRSSPSTVKLLIKRGAHINAEGGQFGTALQAACAGLAGADL